MKRVAVVLSGCGFKDGSEIIEAVSTLITLSELGADYKIFAPDIDFTPTNHLTGKDEPTRNVLSESARIARGEIENLNKLNTNDFDALAFPGGFGAALRLCSWGQEGSQCSVVPEVENVIKAFYKEGKPIAAVCIAPALVARVLGSEGITVTIGNDKDTAAEIEKTGARHENCPVDDYVTDREHKIITSPAYMYGDEKPHRVFTGVRKALKELVEMA